MFRDQKKELPNLANWNILSKAATQKCYVLNRCLRFTMPNEARHDTAVALRHQMVTFKSYKNKVTLRQQNLSKNAASFWTAGIFRSFHTGNIGSAGQRTAKLPAVKVLGPIKKSTDSAITAKVWVSVISPGSTPTRAESFSKFDGP